MRTRNNYQLFQEEIVNVTKLNKKPRLLLHTCCAVCFCSTFMQVKDYFEVVVFFYNPNIYPLEEYNLRLSETKRIIEIFKKEFSLTIEFIEKTENYQNFLDKKSELYSCSNCFSLRLSESFKAGIFYKCDYVTTTLTLGRNKNSDLINELGLEINNNFANIKYLISDFKKNKGIDLSLALIKKYEIYAQKYCGCLEKNINNKT